MKVKTPSGEWIEAKDAPKTTRLQSCPDCGHQVSRSAVACPGCGRSLSFGIRIFWAIFAAMIVLGFVWAIFYIIATIAR